MDPSQKLTMGSECIPLILGIKPLAMLQKPLPPSPESAPTLFLERQNQALREEAKILNEQVYHLRRLLDYYRHILNANKSFVDESFKRLNQLQDAIILTREEEERIRTNWEEYLRSEGAVSGELANFF